MTRLICPSITSAISEAFSISPSDAAPISSAIISDIASFQFSMYPTYGVYEH